MARNNHLEEVHKNNAPLPYSTETPHSDLRGPVYLEPSSLELVIDAEGIVHGGSILALVEKLTWPWSGDPSDIDREQTFQRIFLDSFRTFTNAEELFGILVARYKMQCPNNLPEEDREEWQMRLQLRTQRRILTLLAPLWEGFISEEKKSIAKPLQNFLNQIPVPLKKTADLILTRIGSAEIGPEGQEHSELPCPASPQRKGLGPTTSDHSLEGWSPSLVAEQLTLFEFSLFSKIKPRECFVTVSGPRAGPLRANLESFCASYDQLVAWTKTSILTRKRVGERATIVCFWIKVAQKCHELHNFLSMSAVVTALTTTLIQNLKCTWSLVPGKCQSILDGISILNDPSGGFSQYRRLVWDAEGPCVPFIAMYLNDIARISEKFTDFQGRISFLRRQRCYEVVQTMLRSQKRPYDNICESSSVLSWISACLAIAGERDEAWIESSCKEVMRSESTYAEEIAILGGDPPMFTK
ncbi:ras guanine nucleotide exchange factor domain-containing protein [Mycena leptocephala]|nr:ras guanine nucleotide exchange factor domain-containing protein [Mycena leptocephala]